MHEKVEQKRSKAAKGVTTHTGPLRPFVIETKFDGGCVRGACSRPVVEMEGACLVQ